MPMSHELENANSSAELFAPPYILRAERRMRKLKLNAGDIVVISPQDTEPVIRIRNGTRLELHTLYGTLLGALIRGSLRLLSPSLPSLASEALLAGLAAMEKPLIPAPTRQRRHLRLL